MATNFEPHESVIFAQSTKIGTHENNAIQIVCLSCIPKKLLDTTHVHKVLHVFTIIHNYHEKLKKCIFLKIIYFK